MNLYWLWMCHQKGQKVLQSHYIPLHCFQKGHTWMPTRPIVWKWSPGQTNKQQKLNDDFQDCFRIVTCKFWSWCPNLETILMGNVSTYPWRASHSESVWRWSLYLFYLGSLLMVNVSTQTEWHPIQHLPWNNFDPSHWLWYEGLDIDGC